MYIKRNYFPVIVIGGGQAGLAIGHELKKAKSEFLILEAASRMGESWRRRWDSLRLFSNARHSSLPGMAFPGDPQGYPTKDQVAEYIAEYAQSAELPVKLNTRVLSLERLGKRYLVTTKSMPFQHSMASTLLGGVGRDAKLVAEWIVRNST